MSDTITITGLVATAPRHIVTSEGLAITTFRLASNQRRFDRTQERWVDAETNWYSISTFRQFAINAAASLDKGDRVVVTGRLRLREWDNGERKGINIDIEADALGHDLSWGTSKFSRSITASTAESAQAADEGQSDAAPEAPEAAAFEAPVASERDSEAQAVPAVPF